MRVVSLLVVLLGLLYTTQAEFFTIQVGATSFDNDFMGTPAWNFLRFYPSNITIHPGDTLVFLFKGSRAHTVSWNGDGSVSGWADEDGCLNRAIRPFDAPSETPVDANSKIFNDDSFSSGLRTWTDPEYHVKFPAATVLSSYPYYGTYSFFDLISLQRFQVTVVDPSDVDYPRLPEEVLSDAWTQIYADRVAVANWEVNHNLNLLRVPSKTPSADGEHWTYSVTAGWGIGYAIYSRFLPYEITITAGDTITWTNMNSIPHTVAFNGKNVYPTFPETIQLTNCYRINPRHLLRYTLPEYTAKDPNVFISSGMLYKAGTIEADVPSTFTLTFPEPGVYWYTDTIESDIGMWGKVVVLEWDSDSDYNEEVDSDTSSGSD